MQRFCLVVLRFSLSAWVGIAIYFFVVVLELLDSALTAVPPGLKYYHPEILLPSYFGFAFVLLGTGSICAFLGLWSARISLFRRYATLVFALTALGLAALDYAFVYRGLVALLAPMNSVAAGELVMLYQQSRLLKGAVLGFSIVAVSLAVCPEASEDRKVDPAL